MTTAVRAAAVALSLGLAACARAPEPAPARRGVVEPPPAASALATAPSPIDIQILAYNDFHGNLEPPGGSNGVVTALASDPLFAEHPGAGAVAAADGKRALIPAGGAAYLATHVKRLRAANPRTVVVSAGDLTGASPLVSNLFKDEPTILVMNRLGLDFEGVGNHDFDRGLDELYRLARGGACAGACDGGGFAGASFQYLAANVRRAAPEGGARATIFPPYAIRDIAGARLAFVGVTLRDTPSVTVPHATEGLAFDPETETLNQLLPELREQRVDQMVVLVHGGGHQHGGTYDSCDDLGGDLLGMLEHLDPAFDVVLTGHTHQPYNCTMGGRIVTSAASLGRLITQVVLTWDPAARAFTHKRARNLVVTRDVPEDAEVSAIVAEYAAKARPSLDKVVGYVRGSFARGNLGDEPRPGEKRSCESPAGELIADAMLAATRPPKLGGADIALMNPGGVRSDLFARPAAGEPNGVTYADAFEVQPFANRLVTMTLTGKQLLDLLEMQFDVGRLLQVSSTLTYRVAAPNPPGEGKRPRIEAGSIRIAGRPLDLKKDYRVTVNSFLASGGDRFVLLREGRDPKEGPVDLDALIEYVKSTSSRDKPLDGSRVGGRILGDYCK